MPACRKHVLILALLAWPFVSLSQKEAYFWHFGDMAGIDFNSGAPVAITNSALSSIEGTSSVCDGATGNLLFYTDGITVYNRQNNVMPNGTGLLGNPSSTQCGLIVRLPGTISTYYVFSVDQLAGNSGLRYSIIDMTLDAGFGDVTTKNVQILTPTCEKVTAVRHCNGIDFWILTHEWNSKSIYAYPLTAAGIGSPVVSTVGMAVNGTTSNARGELKLSPDGTKLAAAYDWLGGELYDFDNSTGVVSNPITLATGVQRYGVCFSPDNSKLYMTDGWQGQSIIQYDMAAGNIPASAVMVGTTPAAYIGSLQNAPDGKMYAATYGVMTVGAINNPNALGMACNYVDQAFNLGKYVRWGLPNFPGDVNVAAWGQVDSISVCQGETVTLQAGTGTNYLWNTGATTPSISVTTSGVYFVDWLSNNCTLSDTFVVTVVNAPTVAASATDSTICYGDSTTLTASGATSFVWTPGGPGASITVTPTSTQLYKVVGSTATGCDDSTTIMITVNPLPTVIAGDDISVCSGSYGLLTAGGASNYVWQPGGQIGDSVLVSPTVSTLYTVIGTDANGCSDSADTWVFWRWQLVIDAGPDRSICPGGAVTLAATGAWNYEWEPGAQSGDSVTVSPTVTTTYTVSGSGGPLDCPDTLLVTVTIRTDCPPSIYLPNAFSPNGDGDNDVFGIVYSENFTLDVFQVFNRWGEIIFESSDISAGWDGTFKGQEQPIGSYTFLVSGTYQGEQSVLSGNVTVLR